jgi:hypothetical protein
LSSAKEDDAGSSLRSSLLIFVPLQDADAEPAPINAVPLDQALIVDLHGFDEVHLLGLPGVARIFPDEPPAVGEIAVR